MPPAERNNAIDLLRVLCILYIVGYWHLIPYTHWLPGYANHYTEALKDIALGTFVLSSGLLLARRDLRPRLRELLGFYARRVVRIYPLYLVALLLFGAAGLASQTVVVNGALLISMFVPPAPPTLWFVTMIMFFYLLAPVLMWAAHRPAGFLLTTAALLAVFLGYDAWVRPLDSRLLLFFPSFALGVYIQRVDTARRYLDRKRLYLLALLIPALLVGLPGANGFDVATSLWRAPLVALGAVLSLLYVERFARRLQSPFILRLSYASFGVYLFHRPVFELAMATYYPAEALYQALYLMLVAVPVSFAVAYAVQKGYDAGLEWLTPGPEILPAKAP
ncbi:MAG: acyltransferase [Thiohalobacteraceae bacterium]